MTSAPEIQGVGIGLRHKHFHDFIDDKPEIPWLEVHTENFFSLSSNPSKYLKKIREDYPISAHSVGMSLGSAQPVCKNHLQNIKNFIDYFEPSLVSDHLSWNMAADDNNKIHLPDLLPIPYTQEALDIIIRNISQVQDFLGREILIENPSSYLAYKNNEIDEWEFLVEAAKRSGAKLLLDVNNIHVSAHNHGFDEINYINSIPVDMVKEIHLAGFAINEIEGHKIYIDDHGARVYPEVWNLFESTVQRFGDIPTLIEWDTNVPELAVLLDEARKAEDVVAGIRKAA